MRCKREAYTAYKNFNNLLAHSYLRQQIVSLLLLYVNKLLAHTKQNIFAYATSALTKTKRTVSDPNVKKINFFISSSSSFLFNSTRPTALMTWCYLSQVGMFFLTTLKGKKHYYIHDKQKENYFFAAHCRLAREALW
jgi:hypothetical protein